MGTNTNPGNMEAYERIDEQIKRSQREFATEDKLNKRIKDFKKENEVLKKLVRAAICPECDGSGINAQQVGEQEWEAVQCQWCDTKNDILKND